MSNEELLKLSKKRIEELRKESDMLFEAHDDLIFALAVSEALEQGTITGINVTLRIGSADPDDENTSSTAQLCVDALWKNDRDGIIEIIRRQIDKRVKHTKLILSALEYKRNEQIGVCDHKDLPVEAVAETPIAAEAPAAVETPETVEEKREIIPEGTIPEQYGKIGRSKRIDEKQKKQMKDLYFKQGKGTKEIAEEMKLGYSTVCKYIHNMQEEKLQAAKECVRR